jgi:2-isopropylmalate synthase
MDTDAKFRYFQSLVELGYKEIEVSYPSASQTEFDFTRRLISSPGVVPDNTWLQVMAPCREELIRKTIESVRSANKVILHIHLATSDCFREVVFSMATKETIDLAVRCTRLIRELTKDSLDPEIMKTEWSLEFTPENFQDTSVEFAIEICEAIKAIWEPTEENKIIFNLPSTVEMAMPNIFADQIEIFCDKITEREKVCVSLHNHNDRGCAVATAEMAQLAGADRVEGCLFGNGERTGNVDLVTLALNLYTQGVHPGIDFGNLNQVVALVEELTKIPVHPRAPYAGKYVFCTFTGTHQDAIRKGYKKIERLKRYLGHFQKWKMPYLPMDPVDLGRKHEAIIRVNSQSGKSGIAWLVNESFNLELPRELEIDFTRVVKTHANTTGLEITPRGIESLFQTQYMLSNPAELELLSCNLNERKIDSTGADVEPHVITNGNTVLYLQASVAMKSVRYDIDGSGPGLLMSIMNAVKPLGFDFELLDHKTQLLGSSESNDQRRNASFVKLGAEDTPTLWGVGIHEDLVWASLQAVSITVMCSGAELTERTRF